MHPIHDLGKDDARICGCWDEVAARFSIIERRATSGCWASEVRQDGTAVITSSPTAHSTESLAHELLHLRLQLRGYRRLRLIVWPSQEAYAPRFLTMLDNELQHHRMFSEYQAMGLDVTRFYNDDDKGTARYLDRSLRCRYPDFRQLLCDYVTLMAPGGVLTDAQRAAFHSDLRRMSKGCFAAQSDEVDKLLAAWVHANDLNAEPCVRGFIHLFGRPAYAWIGYGSSEEFPANGFFADEPFELDLT